MGAHEFDFEQVFGSTDSLPTEYDHLPDPATMTPEERVKETVRALQAYEILTSPSAGDEEMTERADIGINNFFRWIGLREGELEEAQSILREQTLDRILAARSGASPEEYSTALEEKSRLLAERELKRKRQIGEGKTNAARNYVGLLGRVREIVDKQREVKGE